MSDNKYPIGKRIYYHFFWLMNNIYKEQYIGVKNEYRR